MKPIDNTNHDKIPKKIFKKTIQPYFDEVASAKKQFDVRINDFEVNVGDIIVLQEWDESTKKNSGRELEFQVGYLLKTKDVEAYTKEDIEKYGFVVMSLTNNK